MMEDWMIREKPKPKWPWESKQYVDCAWCGKNVSVSKVDSLYRHKDPSTGEWCCATGRTWMISRHNKDHDCNRFCERNRARDNPDPGLIPV